MENLSVQRVAVGLFFNGCKAKQRRLRRELHSAKVLSAGRLLPVTSYDNAKFR